MAALRAIPRSSFALILSALMLSISIMFAAVYTARGDNHDQTFYACLFAGSLSQVNTTAPPANCGRGTQVEWTSVTDAVPPTVQIREDSVTVEADAVNFAIAECLPGEVATGGGFFTPIAAGANVIQSHPIVNEPFPEPIGWFVAAYNSSEEPIMLIAYAMCIAQG